MHILADQTKNIEVIPINSEKRTVTL